MTGKLVESGHDAREIAKNARRVVVLGVKPEKQATQPAYYVPEYLDLAGIDVVGVPTGSTRVPELFGKKAYRAVRDVPGPIDIVDVFRKAEDLEGHLEDILAAHPRCVWLQRGIRNDAFAARLIEAGIDVVQDKCLMVEHQLATNRV